MKNPSLFKGMNMVKRGVVHFFQLKKNASSERRNIDKIKIQT